MTVHFTFHIPRETFHNETQVLTYATALIPSPTPPDLIIDCNNTNGLTITYSLDFANATLAATAVIKALKTEIPAP